MRPVPLESGQEQAEEQQERENVRVVAFLALLAGLLLTGLGILGLVSPPDFTALVADVQKRSNIYVLAAVRVAIGVILLLAAPASRTPFLLGTVGVLIALAGVISPFMALPLRQSVQRWMAGGSNIPMQVWAGVALALGAFITYATAPRRKK